MTQILPELPNMRGRDQDRVLVRAVTDHSYVSSIDLEIFLRTAAGSAGLSPALDCSPYNPHPTPVAMNIGNRLGSYEIVSALGAGGMGEVYRAIDTKLKRQVAIKILPPLFAADPDRLARLQREAEVLAALNHPNIAAIYGLEEADGVKALVLELVEGEDLSLLLGRGPLPLDEVLPIAKQLCEALEAAHEAGIVHRDLKPANIKRRSDGTVKVLDFGLARPSSREGTVSATGLQQLANSPTITSPATLTAAGMILGTAAYMAPEQVRGYVADRRADIWAFGVVLFEMITGRRLFDEPTISDTLASVLKSTPDWRALPESIPPQLHALLRWCLEKDPKRRLQAIGDARVQIERLIAGESDATSAKQDGDTDVATRAAVGHGRRIRGGDSGVAVWARSIGRTRVRDPSSGQRAAGFRIVHQRNTGDTRVDGVPRWHPDRVRGAESRDAAVPNLRAAPRRPRRHRGHRHRRRLGAVLFSRRKLDRLPGRRQAEENPGDGRFGRGRGTGARQPRGGVGRRWFDRHRAGA